VIFFNSETRIENNAHIKESLTQYLFCIIVVQARNM